MRWSGIGHAAAALVAEQRQRTGRVPAPAVGEEAARRGAAWTRSSLRRSGRTIANTLSSGKLCCSPSEMTMPSSVAAACSSKSKVTQKRLRSASPQARLIRPPNGACTHELHAARLVEEALGDDRRRVEGTTPSAATRRRDVGDELRRRRRSTRPHSAATQSPRARDVRQARRDRLRGAPTTASESSRVRAGRLAEPERDGRRRAVRVLDADAPGLDAADAPGAVAEEEDVARHALDGEVLVDRADAEPLRLLDHLVVRGVGDGAAAGDRREARAAAARGRGRARGRGGGARRAARAAWRRPRTACRARRRSRRAAARGRARRGGRARSSSSTPISPAATVATNCCARMSSAFSGTRSRSRSPARTARTAAAACTRSSRVSGKTMPLGSGAARVPRAADALEERRDRPRRADVAHEVDRADVDAELERGGGHHDRDLARLETALGLEPGPPRHAAVVRDHPVLRRAAPRAGARRARPAGAC